MLGGFLHCPYYHRGVFVCFCLTVLVTLYEEPDKPNNALEYPSRHPEFVSMSECEQYNIQLLLGWVARRPWLELLGIA